MGVVRGHGGVAVADNGLDDGLRGAVLCVEGDEGVAEAVEADFYDGAFSCMDLDEFSEMDRVRF